MLESLYTVLALQQPTTSQYQPRWKSWTPCVTSAGVEQWDPLRMRMAFRSRLTFLLIHTCWKITQNKRKQNYPFALDANALNKPNEFWPFCENFGNSRVLSWWWLKHPAMLWPARWGKGFAWFEVVKKEVIFCPSCIGWSATHTCCAAKMDRREIWTRNSVSTPEESRSQLVIAAHRPVNITGRDWFLRFARGKHSFSLRQRADAFLNLLCVKSGVCVFRRPQIA